MTGKKNLQDPETFRVWKGWVQLFIQVLRSCPYLRDSLDFRLVWKMVISLAISLGMFDQDKGKKDDLAPSCPAGGAPTCPSPQTGLLPPSQEKTGSE